RSPAPGLACLFLPRADGARTSNSRQPERQRKPLRAQVLDIRRVSSPDQSRLEVKSNRAHQAGRRPAMEPKTNTSRTGAAGRIVAGKYWSAPRPYLQVLICRSLLGCVR